MDFELNENQRMLQSSIRDFVDKEIIPHVAEYDKKAEFPWEIIKKMGELGLMGVTIPEQYGGAGLDYVSYAVALEEISRGDGAVGLTVAAHNSLTSGHIYLAGNERQRKKYLVPLAKGEVLGAWGLTEPDSGSDASAMKTKAVLKDGKWILNGSKIFITNGTVASIYVILVQTNPDKKQHGISAFVIEKGQPGLTTRRIKDKLGVRASDTAEIFLDDVKLPRSNLLGKPGEGFVDTLKVLDGGRISIAAWALGIAQAAFEASLRYACQREQFGRPISEFQAIQWKLVDMAVKVEAARLLTHKAAVLKDKGARVSKESAMAKLFAAETGMEVCEEAIQIHGGYGFLGDFPVERYFRDMRLASIGEGTSEIQRLIIARELLKNQTK